MIEQTRSEPAARPPRGFAMMDPELRREIASRGGRSVPPEGRSFSRNRALAAAAGRKGGEASHGGRGRDALPLPAHGTRAPVPAEAAAAQAVE